MTMSHMSIIYRWVVNALAVMLVAYLIPGVYVANFWYALIAALVIGIVNALVRPLVLLLTLPVNILTLGLFTLVVNALMFWLASAFFGGNGFYVSGFGPAFWGALIFCAISWASNALIKSAKRT